MSKKHTEQEQSEEQTVDLKKLSSQELESLGYRTIRQIEMAQRNLQMINMELSSRTPS